MYWRRKMIVAMAGGLVGTAALLAPSADRHARAAGMLLRLIDPKDSSAVASYRRHAVVVTRVEVQTHHGPVQAKIYTPHDVESPPAMVVLHGVHHLGIEEPRLVAFSSTIAEGGMQVITPLLAEIADYRISAASVEVIGGAASYMHQRTGKPPGVLGLSFAGGLALIAATEEKYQRDIDFVVAVGAHHDMERVARFFAIGEAPLPDGSMFRMAPNNYGPMILVFSSPEDFFSGKDVGIARRVLKHLLQTESIEAARPLTAGMSPAGVRMMEQVFAADRQALRERLLASIAHKHAEMALASPRGRLARLRVPVLLIHGEGDDVIPPSETQWLANELPPSLLAEKLVTPLLSHVNLESQPTFVDRLRVVGYMAEMLEAAETE